MSELTQSADAAAERFYEGAYGRILRVMWVLAAVGLAVSLSVYGWQVALGFAVGAALALLNFFWAKRGIVALLDRVERSGQAPSGVAAVARFLLRYLLIGVAAYVIFVSSALSVHGLLAGLILPVAAMMVEAGYELYGALRHGF